MDFADDEVLTIQARVDPATGRPTGAYRNFRQKEFAFFVQDDWKAARRLTLNLGIRHDYFGTLGERNGKLATLLPGATPAVAGRIARVNELFAPDRNNIAPRFGFALDPTGAGKWSVRGGTGIFYSRLWSNFTGNTRFNPPDSLQVTLSALTPWQNPRSAYRIPFAGDPAFARPLDGNGGNTALRPAAQTVDTSLRAPYNIQWFFGVQRRLPGDWVAEVNYLGNVGRQLLLRNEINRFSGDRADGAVNRVNQSFGSVVYGSNGVNSAYNGLTAQLTRRFRSGYTLQAAYTYGRSIDAGSEPFGGGAAELQGSQEVDNLRLDRGLSAFDASHRLAASYLCVGAALLPRTAGLGQARFRGLAVERNRVAAIGLSLHGHYLGGLQPGRRVLRPPEPAAGADRQSWRWTQTIPGRHVRRRRTVGPALRPSPGGSVSQLGRNTFRGPGYATVDMSWFKEFQTGGFVPEGLRWQFRLETFNLFNRVNLRNPSNSLGNFAPATGRWSDPNFGKALLAFEGRQIQLALRISF